MINLDKGEILVTKTDTIYGILARALEKESVEKIYEIKGRDENKPFVIIIPNKDSLRDFGVDVKQEGTKDLLFQSWPGAVTIIFDISDSSKIKELKYLHRGSASLAFRVPKDQFLINLLNETGPLVAPSANPQGKTPAINIKEAERYFGDKIDIYHNRGEVLNNTPSKIIKINKDGQINVIRK